MSGFSKVEMSCSAPSNLPDGKTGDADVEWERAGPVEGVA
jgi:hypothetical protein